MKLTRTVSAVLAAGLFAVVITGCQSTAQPSSAPAASSSASTVLPVNSNPITNTSTTPGLAITAAAVEDNVDPAGKPIGDRLQLTLSNTTDTTLNGLEVYYEMKDAKTGQTEAYYQALGDLTLAPKSQTTIYFDNKTGPGHYPENTFSLYRSSKNQVDFTIEVSASGVKIATATATKSTGTGETAD